jgi:hypothetical protein
MAQNLQKLQSIIEDYCKGIDLKIREFEAELLALAKESEGTKGNINDDDQ